LTRTRFLLSQKARPPQVQLNLGVRWQMNRFASISALGIDSDPLMKLFSPFRLLALVLAAVLAFVVGVAGLSLVSSDNSTLALWVAVTLSYVVLAAGLWLGIKRSGTKPRVAVFAVVATAVLVLAGDIAALFVLWMLSCSFGRGTCL